MLQTDDYLKLSLAQAELGRGGCAPNPAVGAVVVKEDAIISKGYHHGAGQPHAEVEALKGVQDAKGATVYVTLEPCCHHGRTPPCTAYLIERGIERVVYGFEDPNPVVRGKGASFLTANGITVEYRPIPEIVSFYESYAHWVKTQRPRVTLKLAMSLDGKIAPRRGEKYSLTSQVAQHFTYQNRQWCDAILTTVKTVLVDDPQLNVRLSELPVAKPVYVLGRRKIPQTAQLWKTASQVKCLDGDIPSVLSQIGKDGIHDLWIEAGPTLASQWLRAGAVDRAYFYVAPKWLGPTAVPALEGVEAVLSSAKKVRTFSLGSDVGFEMVW